jgi:hypothetical protein
MAKKKVSLLSQIEQPINWFRAFICGIGGASLMMGFLDIFYMMGITPFSYEQYLGSLLRGTMYGQHNWIVGLLANWVVGGIFGFLYAYGFEYIFKRSGGRVGTALGLGHAVIAMVALFPFFTIMHQEVGTGLYPEFGFFGSGLGAPTPILLLMGHLLFGATVGTFYGPVRAYRVRARVYEPGEAGMPGEIGVFTIEDDPRDSALVYPHGG